MKFLVMNSYGSNIHSKISYVSFVSMVWRAVVENPELQKRFSHFVNAPEEKDPSIKFEPLREQKRAMEWKLVEL